MSEKVSSKAQRFINLNFLNVALTANVIGNRDYRRFVDLELAGWIEKVRIETDEEGNPLEIFVTFKEYHSTRF